MFQELMVRYDELLEQLAEGPFPGYEEMAIRLCGDLASAGVQISDSLKRRALRNRLRFMGAYIHSMREEAYLTPMLAEYVSES